ncbi:hypothetical protein Ait01nite_030140 [Actinoplanes italicus]|uniref:Uncharacterized protein n=1 Tax=Actinoplanes italicus TaxID=113567 RepID=A0A2T0KIW4_9ACTN|nr:hypothetical protein [Actinoplanes italicus]PRX23471.1 hypothetical protein CLV67_103219 [Actinoplanes italicus]GIE29969.1 hypothetical protein Ait01nite_030140 [Actinoplanes italicus]
MSEQLGGYRRNVRDLLEWANASDPASPETFARRNLPRIGLYDSAGDTGQVALATGVMTSVPIFLRAGDIITNISVRSGATAAGTPTNYWFALYDDSAVPALLGQTGDQTSTAWAANTTKTLALASPVTVPRTGIYYVGIMVTATTPPTLLGSVAAPAIVTGERALSQSSGSSLTASAPLTITSTTAKQFVPYVVLT